ncbi:MAG TPA: hypothetical protein VMD25_03225 [Acidobacteriaceae bacterium]|nr:hypothetical protein [Acidobacteriaceae bacterium]
MTDPTIRLPAVLGIGFTGHRTLREEAPCRQAILDFLREQQAKSSGHVYGISSAAAGGDLLFAESCMELGIPLRVLLPMAREEFRRDFDAASWTRAEEVLGRAASVEVTAGSEDRREQFYDCGVLTVQQSQVLLALWDGQPSRGMGGTAEIVAFAETIGRPVVWLHSETCEPQVRNGGAIGKTLDDPELNFLNGLSDRGIRGNSDDPASLACAWFSKVDANASRLAPVARRLASVPVLYTAAAALFSAFAAHARNAAAWLGVSMVLGVFAVVLPQVLGLDSRQRKWARTRTAAEVCRSYLALWNAPLAYDAIGPEMLPELAGVLTSLGYLRLRDEKRKAVSLEEFRKEYGERRLEDQIGYFAEKAAGATREARIYRGLTWSSGVLAVLTAGWLFAGRGHLPFSRRWMELLISTLFQLATVAGALVVINDCDRRRERYRELEQWLRNWVSQFGALQTWSSLQRVTARVERALVVELLEWRSLTRHAKLPRK